MGHPLERFFRLESHAVVSLHGQHTRTNDARRCKGWMTSSQRRGPSDNLNHELLIYVVSTPLAPPVYDFLGHIPRTFTERQPSPSALLARQLSAVPCSGPDNARATS